MPSATNVLTVGAATLLTLGRCVAAAGIGGGGGGVGDRDARRPPVAVASTSARPEWHASLIADPARSSRDGRRRRWLRVVGSRSRYRTTRAP